MTLPPWLQIRPQEFTESAIAGSTLGFKSANEAAELAQRGIMAAQEIANKAEQLQVQRENIAADLAARQMANAQRAAEAGMENGIRQQQFDLQKAAQAEAGARIAQQDALWQEGRSRYDRALASGEDAAAADLAYLSPLRTGGGKSTSTGNDWSGPINLGGGQVIQVNKRTGEKRNVQEGNAGTETRKLDDVTKRRLGVIEREITGLQRALNSPDTVKSRRDSLAQEIQAKKAEWETLIGGTGQSVTETFTPPEQLPVGYIGAPGTGTGNQMQWSPPTGTMIPPMPGASAAPAQNYRTATNPKTGATVIFKEGKWQRP